MPSPAKQGLGVPTEDLNPRGLTAGSMEKSLDAAVKWREFIVCYHSQNIFKQGWTLIELMIVLFIIGVVLSMALLSFHSMFSKAHSKVAEQQILSAIRLARSEAIKNGAISSLSPQGGDWSRGQVITVARHIMKEFPAVPDVTIIWEGFPAGDQLRFVPSGFVYGGNGTFSICSSGECSKILVSKSGRVRVVSPSD